jgi:two-component system LytT family response regulator
MLTVLIVDDEEIGRRRIARLLSEEADVEIVGECADGQQAVAVIRQRAPDVLFLDVQMPGLDGFGVLRALEGERLPATIFVTAYEQYALKAFEVFALDYLLKPFDTDRFRAAFRRARELVERESSAERSERLVRLLERLSADQRQLEELAATARTGGLRRGAYLDRLMVKSGGRVFFIKVDEIDWIEAAGNYVRLHVGKDALLVRESMAAMEEKLDPAQFARMHRSTIVNLDRIKEMQPWFTGEYTVLLRDGTQLKLSRWYRDKLEERMRIPT